QFDPVHLRHLHVSHHNLYGMFFQESQGLKAVGRPQNRGKAVIGPRHVVHEFFLDRLFIFDQQKSEHSLHPFPSTTGSLIVAVTPPPGVGLNAKPYSGPKARRIRSLTLLSPKYRCPVPLSRRQRLISSILAGSMPAPLSIT